MTGFTLPEPVTSVVVKTGRNCSFTGSYIIDGRDTVFLRNDSHNNTDSLLGSQLILFSQPIKVILFYPADIRGTARFYLFNTGAGNKKKENVYRTDEVCAEPFSVSQSAWRDGLPDPIESPVSTPVFHIIVHHSAGSNLARDYEEEVRNIYLLHTRTNGFDDIGYNYLVAPDGTIFKGRDGKGLADQDDVRGAHMCNKNDSTMAICMLGTFTDVLPTEAALSSLSDLAGWKAAKNNLDVMGVRFHSQGPTSAGAPGKMLPVVAGHRDGCTPFYTECPGETLYANLAEIRENILQKQQKCVLTGLERIMENKQINLDINNIKVAVPAEIQTEIRLINMSGQEVFKTVITENTAFELKQGLYLLEIKGDKPAIKKILVP